MWGGRFVAAVLALSLIGSSMPLWPSERLSLLGSLVLLERKLISLEEKLQASESSGLALKSELDQTRSELAGLRAELTALRSDLETATGSWPSFSVRVKALEERLERLSASLAASERRSREKDSEISKWRSRARRRGMTAVGLAIIAALEFWQIVRR